MYSLTSIALWTGVALVVLGVLGVFRTPTMQRLCEAFPRNRTAALLFTLVNVIWVAVMVYHAPLGRFEWVKPYMYILAPATFFAVIFFMDELLAPRMLGGFLLLAANPALNAARWHDSAWRYVLTVLVYFWIVWAMIIMLSPYRFRHTLNGIFCHGRAKPVFGVLLALGVLLAVLAVTVY